MKQVENETGKNIISNKYNIKSKRGRPPKGDEKRVSLQVTMTPENANKIKEIASLLGLSVSDFIYYSLKTYLHIPQKSK